MNSVRPGSGGGIAAFDLSLRQLGRSAERYLQELGREYRRRRGKLQRHVILMNSTITANKAKYAAAGWRQEGKQTPREILEDVRIKRHGSQADV
jgi:hypothetical protein